MVPFAYKVYQDYEMGLYDDGADKTSKKKKVAYINNFKATFCRHDSDESLDHNGDDCGVKVYFLGLFDTVSSVVTLDVPFSNKMTPPKDEDIKEVWFPGNHGDVGGGWQAVDPAKKKLPKTFLERLKSIIRSEQPEDASEDASKDFYQLSDIPLKWMIDELEHLDHRQDENSKIKWSVAKDGFLKHFMERSDDALSSDIHDTRRFGGGSSWGKVVFWNFMGMLSLRTLNLQTPLFEPYLLTIFSTTEYLPFTKRWVYVMDKIGYRWQYVTFPLNKGGTRDIPEGAFFHHSVLERMRKFKSYRPENTVSITSKGGKPLKHIDMKYVQAHEEYDESQELLPKTSFGVHEKRKSRPHKYGLVETDPTWRLVVSYVARMADR
ncbi:hypothetical protein MMC13_000293 [Lambiella insularis]|nr:hypothetical protein [Lambiella insularis]